MTEIEVREEIARAALREESSVGFVVKITGLPRESVLRLQSELEAKELRAFLRKSAVFQSWVKDEVDEEKAEVIREAVCQFLAHNFGADSQDLQRRVKQINKFEVLEQILNKIFTSRLLDEAAAVVDDASVD